MIRGIQPIDGIEKLSYNRFGITTLNHKQHLNLTNGPAKICQAFGINKDQNGIDLTGNSMYLLDANPPTNSKIIKTTRVGIKSRLTFHGDSILK